MKPARPFLLLCLLLLGAFTYGTPKTHYAHPRQAVSAAVTVSPSPLPRLTLIQPLRASRSREDLPAKVSVPPATLPKPKQVTHRTQVVTGSRHDVTMYCDTGSRTASGKWPGWGMVATMRRDLPFGTVVHIAGLGDFVVEDRIGHGSEFDLFTHSCSEARAFGRRHLRVSFN